MTITKDWLEDQLNYYGLGVYDIADKAECSYSNIYRLIKKWDIKRTHQIEKQCEQCGGCYQASTTHGTHLRRRWCSKNCREVAWKKENPERVTVQPQKDGAA